MKPIYGPPLERILARITIDPDPGCWLYPRKAKNGYAILNQTNPDGSQRYVYAHRVTYEHMVGPIPKHLNIDHLCRVTHCCNPDHLEAVTPAENVRRAVPYMGERRVPKVLPDACPQGHWYDETNLRITKDGYPKCRLCHIESSRRAAAEKRATIGPDVRANVPREVVEEIERRAKALNTTKNELIRAALVAAFQPTN